eukprot:jgi/Chrzof1/7203/Cz02g14200.t1
MVLSSCKSDASTQAEQHWDAVRRQPLKRRGLSRFYANKSQSFSSFQDLTSVTPLSSSSILLAKRCRSWDRAHQHSSIPEDQCSCPGSISAGSSPQWSPVGSPEHSSDLEASSHCYGSAPAGSQLLDVPAEQYCHYWVSDATEGLCDALRLTRLSAPATPRLKVGFMQPPSMQFPHLGHQAVLVGSEGCCK